MGNHNDIPCRVSAETRAHYAAANSAEPDKFDPTDEECLRDVVSKGIAKPLASLFSALSQLEMTEGSFGADAKKALEYLRPEVVALRAAAKQEWRDAL